MTWRRPGVEGGAAAEGGVEAVDSQEGEEVPMAAAVFQEEAGAVFRAWGLPAEEAFPVAPAPGAGRGGEADPRSFPPAERVVPARVWVAPVEVSVRLIRSLPGIGDVPAGQADLESPATPVVLVGPQDILLDILLDMAAFIPAIPVTPVIGTIGMIITGAAGGEAGMAGTMGTGMGTSLMGRMGRPLSQYRFTRWGRF